MVGRSSSGERAEARALLRVLEGERLARPPWWLMRQAGRYLPEYRALRAKATDFVEFCLTPALAAEATMQPVRRFGMDAAIVFADILLVPLALGQGLSFGDDGPVLEAIEDAGGLAALGHCDRSRLDPVYETIRLSRAGLPETTALIGFAGAPWTVATYMVEGGTSRDFRRVKAFAYRDPVGFAALIDLIGEATIDYLSGQILAGAEVVQLFDSWAGVLAEPGFARWVIEPTRRLVGALRKNFPAIKIIGFPRGAGLLYEGYAAETGVNAVSIDTQVPVGFVRDRLQGRVAVQGNLDPVVLLVGGDALAQEVRRVCGALAGGPFVLNLGHGILPQTPPEHVAALARLIAGFEVAA